MRNIFWLWRRRGLAMAGWRRPRPWCAAIRFACRATNFPGLSNCTFTSYQQCQASASGRFLPCVANPSSWRRP